MDAHSFMVWIRTECDKTEPGVGIKKKQNMYLQN